MKARDKVAQIKRIIREMDANREREALLMSNDVLALIKRRIINQQLDHEGNKFPMYSKAVVPFWYYKGKETIRNNAKAVADLLKRFGYFASYADWRTVNNLTNDFINFVFTGRMWASIRPILINKTKDLVKFELRSSNKKEQEKLEHHNERFGNILRVSKEERSLLQSLNQQRVQRYLDQIY